MILPRIVQEMKVIQKEQSDEMQELMDTEGQDSTLKLFLGETFNSSTKAGSEEMIQLLNQ